MEVLRRVVGEKVTDVFYRYICTLVYEAANKTVGDAVGE